MNRVLGSIAGLACLAAAHGAGAAEQTPPPWAYPVLAPGVQGPPDDGVKRSVPGSGVQFTAREMFNLFDAHDWFPGDHPPMPEVVVHGRAPDVRACSMCHYPNGQGR